MARVSRLLSNDLTEEQLETIRRTLMSPGGTLILAWLDREVNNLQYEELHAAVADVPCKRAAREQAERFEAFFHQLMTGI